MAFDLSGEHMHPVLGLIQLTSSASAQLRATLITLFLSRFTLSEEEKTALTSRDVTVGPAVFAALDRVEAIRQDSQALLSGDEERMQAG